MQKIRLYKSGALRIAAIVICVIWAGFIFSMSAEPASASADRSGGITEKIVKMFVSDFDEMSSVEKRATISFVDHIIRKIAHFCIYTILGALVCFASFGYNASYFAHLARTWVIGTLYAASDEVHQYFVPGRGPGVLDVLLDSVGVICGILVVVLAVRLIKKGNKNGA